MPTQAIEASKHTVDTLALFSEPTEIAHMNISNLTERQLKIWLGLLYFARNDLNAVLFSKEGQTTGQNKNETTGEIDANAVETKRQQIIESMTHTVKITDLEALTCPGLDRHETRLVEEAKKLCGLIVEINVLGKNKKRPRGATSNLVASIDDLTKEGYLIYDFSRVIKGIATSRTMWQNLSLTVVSKLHTKAALGLYRLCNDYRGIPQTSEIAIEDLKKILGVSGQYETFNDLKRYVLEPAIKRLNEGTDLAIEGEYQKVGRKVASVRFRITEGGQQCFDLKPKQTKKSVRRPKSISDKNKREILAEHETLNQEIGTAGWTEVKHKRFRELAAIISQHNLIRVEQ